MYILKCCTEDRSYKLNLLHITTAVFIISKAQGMSTYQPMGSTYMLDHVCFNQASSATNSSEDTEVYTPMQAVQAL